METKTSITIDDELWKRLKVHSARIGKPMKKILEELIKQELKR